MHSGNPPLPPPARNKQFKSQVYIDQHTHSQPLYVRQSTHTSDIPTGQIVKALLPLKKIKERGKGAVYQTTDDTGVLSTDIPVVIDIICSMLNAAIKR